MLWPPRETSFGKKKKKEKRKEKHSNSRELGRCTTFAENDKFITGK
jgi:hypothetical protein